MTEALTDVSGLERLRMMLEIVGRLRLEVAKMEKALDELWQRTCPVCLQALSKTDPQQLWKCEKCGWEE